MRTLLALLLLCSPAIANNPHASLVERVNSAKTLRVLFIGNSYSFQIPNVFKKIALDEGQKIEVDQATQGGWTLSKHSAARATLDKIANGNWDVVVLQEQSIIPALPMNQRNRMMNEPARKLASAIRKAGAIPVFFLTWGRKDGDKRNAAVFPNDTYAAMQKRLVAGYKNAASHAGRAHIVPVGEVWSALRQMKKDKGLYTRDGSHPGKRGNYLGACVFYSTLYNKEVQKQAQGIADSESIRRVAATAALSFGG
jgi:hypothetical protein